MTISEDEPRTLGAVQPNGVGPVLHVPNGNIHRTGAQEALRKVRGNKPIVHTSKIQAPDYASNARRIAKGYPSQ